jgi:hypothetical protein
MVSLSQVASQLYLRNQAAAEYLAQVRFRAFERRRRKSRQNLICLLPKASVGAELGVFKGEFSVEILRHVAPRELHLVDVWWEAFGEFYPDWGRYTDFGRLRTRAAYERAVEVATQASPSGTKLIFHVGDDLPYLRSVPDGYFDWVYIDSSHEYAHTAAELAILVTKVRRGGLICGDDWTDDEGHVHAGVARAVKEFLADHVAAFELKYLRSGQWLLGPPGRQN